MQAGDHSIQRIQTEQLMVLGTITSGLTSTTVVLMLQVDWSHQVDVKHPVLVLRIESPQIHIPNGVDVLKLCFKCSYSAGKCLVMPDGAMRSSILNVWMMILYRQGFSECRGVVCQLLSQQLQSGGGHITFILGRGSRAG